MCQPINGHDPSGARFWSADTGCFISPHKHEDEAYLEWLSKHIPISDRCLFATAPDVRPEFHAYPAEETIAKSLPMLPRIRLLGFRAALVAQDGLERCDVPWDAFDALFIGGSTSWKLGTHATALIRQAKDRDKWVHVGRVNSLRRLRHVQWQGADSADGTFLAFGPDINLPRMRRWLAAIERQPLLFTA